MVEIYYTHQQKEYKQGRLPTIIIMGLGLYETRAIQVKSADLEYQKEQIEEHD